MESFTIYPAIDLRNGQVVRLAQGDPERQTVYSSDPAGMAERWIDAGAEWLHVVNLDGAFGDQENANLKALRSILAVAQGRVKVQFGGGLREMADLEKIIAMGASRVILGTAAVESPTLPALAVESLGNDRVAVGIDARDDRVRVRGWTEGVDLSPIKFGHTLTEAGIQTVIFTDIARDGVGTGVNIQATSQLAGETGLHVIASGGIESLDQVSAVRNAQLPGVIIGRALYAGNFSLKEALEC